MFKDMLKSMIALHEFERGKNREKKKKKLEKKYK